MKLKGVKAASEVQIKTKINKMFGRDTSIDKLRKSSDKITSVFTKTINELTTVNQEIDEHIDARDEEIRRINAEKEQLSCIKEQNTTFLTKLTKIFE